MAKLTTIGAKFSNPLTVWLLPLVLLTACINDGTSGTGSGDGINRDGDMPAAQVAGSTVYLSDVISAAKAQKRIGEGETLSPEDPAFEDVLQELIDQRLLMLAAKNAGTENVPEVRRRLAVAREQILARHYVQSHLNNTVTEDSLKALYDSQSALAKNGNEANVRLIRVKTEDEITAVIKDIAAGEDFGELAGKLSIDKNSRSNNGELGFVSRVMLPTAVANAVFATKSGTISKPFKTQDGWNIVEVLGTRKPQRASFESMRAQLREYKTYSEIQNLMTNLRDKAEVERLLPAPRPKDAR